MSSNDHESLHYVLFIQQNHVMLSSFGRHLANSEPVKRVGKQNWKVWRIWNLNQAKRSTWIISTQLSSQRRPENDRDALKVLLPQVIMAGSYCTQEMLDSIDLTLVSFSLSTRGCVRNRKNWRTAFQVVRNSVLMVLVFAKITSQKGKNERLCVVDVLKAWQVVVTTHWTSIPIVIFRIYR